MEKFEQNPQKILVPWPLEIFLHDHRYCATRELYGSLIRLKIRSKLTILEPIQYMAVDAARVSKTFLALITQNGGLTLITDRGCPRGSLTWMRALLKSKTFLTRITQKVGLTLITHWGCPRNSLTRRDLLKSKTFLALITQNGGLTLITDRGCHRGSLSLTRTIRGSPYSRAYVFHVNEPILITNFCPQNNLQHIVALFWPAIVRFTSAICKQIQFSVSCKLLSGGR